MTAEELRRDRKAIDQAQHAVGMRKRNALAVPLRKLLVAAIQSPELTDKEIYTRYLAIKREDELCTSSATDASRTAASQISEMSTSRAF